MNRIFDDGRRHPLILSSNCPEELYSEIRSGICRSCLEHDFPLEHCCFVNDDPESSMRQVEALLESGQSFDAVMLTGVCWQYWDFLKQHFELKRECRVFGGELTLFSDMKFTGYMVTRKMEEPARILADNFIRQMESPHDAPLLMTDIEVDFVFCEDGLPVRDQSTMEGRISES